MISRLLPALTILGFLAGCASNPYTLPEAPIVIGPLGFLADETTNTLHVASAPEGQNAAKLIVKSTYPIIFSLDGKASHMVGSDTRSPSGKPLGPSTYTLTSKDYLTLCGYEQGGPVTVTIWERHESGDIKAYEHAFPSMVACT